jgi:predicted RNA-binding protein with PIN domain
MTIYLVDGMNVIGSRPDGWWRDRPKAMRRLVDDLDRFAVAGDHETAVVFDGAPFDLDHDGPTTVTFATRRGRNAADDDIARLADATTTVVTSDDDLVRRVTAKGAATVGARTFRDLLD